MKALLEPPSSCLCLREGGGGMQGPSPSCQQERTGCVCLLPCPWTWDGACMLPWLSLLLHFFSPSALRRTKIKLRLGNQCKIQNEPKFQLPDHLHLSAAHLCPSYMFTWGCFLISLYFLLIFSRNRDVHPRLSELDFHVTVSHGEDQISTDKHPTLPSIPSANISPVVCAESCKC